VYDGSSGHQASMARRSGWDVPGGSLSVRQHKRDDGQPSGAGRPSTRLAGPPAGI